MPRCWNARSLPGRLQQRDATPERLANLLQNIFAAPDELAARAAAAHGLGKPDAAARLADLVERLGEAA